MNSPLFFRKVLRTQIEPDFQNLETFQKSQIQNKVSYQHKTTKMKFSLISNYLNYRLTCALRGSSLLCRTKHPFGMI